MSEAVQNLARPSRRAVLSLGLASLVAACSRGPSFLETIDDVPYVPVDPSRAQKIINAYRAENGSGPLELDHDLVRIAGDYARHLAEAGRMTHALDPYGPLDQRLKSAGYAYATAGENLGQGYRTLEQTILGWKHSPAHDRGMKDAEMTRMGIASAENPRRKGDAYWCLIVAKPRPPGSPQPMVRKPAATSTGFGLSIPSFLR